MFYGTASYREAVTQHSPGLSRFAATLGTEVRNDLNPNGVVSFLGKQSVPFMEGTAITGSQPASLLVVNEPALPLHHDVGRSQRDTTPLGLRATCKPFPQGSREARQPWAVFRNRFAVPLSKT
jgi:hypothetical protein